jgi:hypothetical protein
VIGVNRKIEQLKNRTIKQRKKKFIDKKTSNDAIHSLIKMYKNDWNRTVTKPTQITTKPSPKNFCPQLRIKMKFTSVVLVALLVVLYSAASKTLGLVSAAVRHTMLRNNISNQ